LWRRDGGLKVAVVMQGSLFPKPCFLNGELTSEE
jgi:hypothetical protein